MVCGNCNIRSAHHIVRCLYRDCRCELTDDTPLCRICTFRFAQAGGIVSVDLVEPPAIIGEKPEVDRG